MTSPAMSQDAVTPKIYNAQTTTLTNGMQVVVVDNPRTPAVTHMVWYKLGGADEPVGLSGLAHYLEHLMFKGSTNVPAGEFSKRVKAWGGNDNAFTSWDFTAYFQTVPKDKLRDVMMMEADRVRGLNFDDDDALTERDVIIEERKQRTDSSPSAQLWESMRSTLFVNHPYARPIIGWEHEIAALDPVQIRDFYNQYYAPQNAILIVSGDARAQDVFDMAEDIYGKIENGMSEKRPVWPSIPNTYGSSTITHAHEDVQHRSWYKLYRVPSASQDYKASLAFSILENIVGDNTGRLYKSLVRKQKIASATGFGYNGTSVADGTLSFSVTPLDKIDIPTIDTHIEALLNDIATNGITEDELSRAISQLEDESVYELDSLNGPAMMLGYLLSTGVSLDQAEYWIRDLRDITVTDVQDVVKNYLLPNADSYHSVTGILKPKEK